MSSSENEKLIGYVVICISLIMIIHLMWNDNYFKYQNEHMEQLVASPLSKPESIPAPIINVDSNMGCKSNPVPILPPVIQNVPVIDTIKHLGKLYVTDNKYRIMACIDERAEPWISKGTYTIWNFALEHNNEKINYGVYVNGGLLVETCCINFLKFKSNMELIN